jgi:hypothetical protein
MQPGARRTALVLSLTLGSVASSGCSSRATELGHHGEEPASGDAATKDAAAARAATGGSGGTAVSGAGGQNAVVLDASSGGATSPSRLPDASVAPGDDSPFCQGLSCPWDGGCGRLDVQLATTCQLLELNAPSTVSQTQTLTIGCGAVATLIRTDLGKLMMFDQTIYDLHTGEEVGLRSLMPNNGLPKLGLAFRCADSRADVRRQAMNSAPWDDCPTARRCTVCTAPPDMSEPDPPCTPDDFAALAPLGDAGR